MDLDPAEAPTALTGTQWKNYGHHRLYIARGKEKVAWADLKTGAVQITDDTETASVQEFMQAWAREEGIQWPPTPAEDTAIEDHEAAPAQQPLPQEDPQPPTAPALPATAKPTAPIAVDLAMNKPGEAAQAVADELLIGVSRFRRFLHALFNVHTDARAWAKGAEGERMVADQLARLGPEWRTLHAVNVGTRGSDIDHVLVGPAGVITVNSKNHSGRKVWVRGDGFLVNGSKQTHVRNSRHEGARAAKLLTAACGFEVPTTALIAVVASTSDMNIKAQPDDGVHVSHYKAARRWIHRQPVMLTPTQVDAVYSAARISTTWV